MKPVVIPFDVAIPFFIAVFIILQWFKYVLIKEAKYKCKIRELEKRLKDYEDQTHRDKTL